MVPACLKGKLRHLHQVPWSSSVNPTSRMGTCYTLQIARQVMGNGDLRCSSNKGSCRRSSVAMVIWWSQIDVCCVCSQGPQIMSRPGPRSGTRSRRFFAQNNTCSSWCEGCGPIRRVHGKPRYAVNNTKAEALWRNSYEGARSHPTQLASTPCAPHMGHTFPCAPLSGHMLLFSNLWLCTAGWFSKLVLPIVRPPCF